MKRISKCVVCGAYTMKDTHCNQKTLGPKPAKYSPEDKFGKYRRQAKKEKGLV